MITDPDEVYAGAIVRASVTSFSYDVSGNKGVSFALNNVQKIRDGERLDGRARAQDDFQADPNAKADLADMEPESEGGKAAPAGADELDELFG